MLYDLIIIGAGPAGITASVYAARKRMNFLVVTQDIGGQAAWSADIENYTGYQFITGMELVDKFREHLEKFEVEIKTAEPVLSVQYSGELIKVITGQAEYLTKTVIIASGRVPRKLGVKGEDELKNLGVTYCATCDGPLFEGMTVAVIGGGNSALDATLQLIKIAEKIYLIDISPQLRADPVMIEKAEISGKVEFFNLSKVEAIYGEHQVKGVKISKEGKTFDLEVQGVFIEVGSVPSSDLIAGIAKNKMGEILVNCKCETNLPGVFAAGDVTDVFTKQIIVACGEGSKAALAAFEYLSLRKDQAIDHRP
jgi:NADH-dependent peroxiredoxin subunit F